MPETGGINAGGSIKNIGSESPKNQSYEYFRTPQKQKVFKLHVGELVQATVMTTPQDSTASVRLPTGTMIAELQGQLKKGDTLFFRVESIEPNLVLKIYSVPLIVAGKKISIDELIRILDLPNNSTFLDIVKFLCSSKNIIVRHEALLLSSHLKNLDDNLIKTYPKEALLKTLNFLYQTNIKFNNNLFIKFLPVFLGAKFFEKTLRKLEKQIHFLPSAIQDNFIAYYGNLISSDVKNNIFKFINLVESEVPGEETFYIFLTKIRNEIKSDFPNEYTVILNAVEDIINALEGQFLHNLIADKMNLNSYLFCPVFQKNQIKIIQLNWQKVKEDSVTNKSKINFSFVVESDTFASTTAKGSVKHSQAEMDFIINDKFFAEKVSKGLEILKRKLSSDNFVAKSLQVIDIDEEDIKTIQDESTNKGSSFSVVI